MGRFLALLFSPIVARIAGQTQDRFRRLCLAGLCEYGQMTSNLWGWAMTRFWGALAVVFVLSGPALAGGATAADQKKVHDYVLAIDKVKAFYAATDALMAALPENPTLAAEYEDLQREQGISLAEDAAHLKAHPDIFAFYSDQGLSAEEPELISLSLITAGFSAHYPSKKKKDPMVSQAHIDFMKANKAFFDEQQKKQIDAAVARLRATLKQDTAHQ
jgi:hypothetical protein